MRKVPDRLRFGKQDVCEVLFSHAKTVRTAKRFIRWLKGNGGEASRSEVSAFAHDLSNGRLEGGFRYARKNFYGTVLRRLQDTGFLSLQSRYDSKAKRGTRYVYAPVDQPIPNRPPLGGPSFWRNAWELCRLWNETWTKEE